MTKEATNKVLKNYYKIDEAKCYAGTLELWEHNTLGEFAASILTLNGEKIAETFDDIWTAWEEYAEECEVMIV